ncbi:MAG: hypothetical protein AAF693_22555 [Bacteroidota bacterium]
MTPRQPHRGKPDHPDGLRQMQGVKPVYGAMAGGRLKRLGFILPLYFPNQQPELCFDLCAGILNFLLKELPLLYGNERMFASNY